MRQLCDYRSSGSPVLSVTPQPTGVFSRLGATPETDEDLAWDSDNDSSSSGLEDASLSVSPVTWGGARGRDSPEQPGAETLSPRRRRGLGPRPLVQGCRPGRAQGGGSQVQPCGQGP